MRPIIAALVLSVMSIVPASAQNPALETVWSYEAASPVVTAPLLVDIDGVQEKRPDAEIYLKHREVLFGTEDGRVLVLGMDHRPLAGWPVNIDGSAPLGMAVADLDNKYEGPTPEDLAYHPEIVVSTRKGALVAYNWHGKKLWTARTPAPVTRRPSLADVNGDGWLDVVTLSNSSGLIFDGRNGAPLRRIPVEDPQATLEAADIDADGVAEIVLSSPKGGEVSVSRADGSLLPGWPVKQDQPGAPIVADVDDDGMPEVIVPFDGGLTALKTDGTPAKGWPLSLKGTIGTLASGDINRDGKLEIVLVDVDATLPARLWALRGDGRPLPGFPMALPGSEGTSSVSLTIAPLSGGNAPDLEVMAAGKDASQLYVVRVSDATLASQGKYAAGAKGIALDAAQSRTLAAIPDGTKLQLMRAAEGSAKPWAFDWPMDSRTPEGNRVYGFPVMLADQTAASPIAVDLDGDGKQEILVGTADSSGRQGSENSRVYAIRSNGSLVTGWPVQVPEDASSLVAGDLQGDGKIEVVLSGWDGTLRAWSADGKPLWPAVVPPEKPRHLGGAVLVDLNGDGKREIVFGTMKSGTEGRVYACSADGKLLWQYPSSLNGFTMPMTSDPAVGDLDGDGKPEIVITTLSSVSDTGVTSARYFALKSNGKLLWGDDKVHSVAASLYSSPVLADINGDGKLEILFGSTGYIDANGKVQTDGKLYVLKADGSALEGWPKALADYGEPSGWIFSTPAVGDVDDDGKPEIAVGSAGTYYFDAKSGYSYNSAGSKVYLWKSDGTLVRGYPYDAKDPVYGSPIIADADGNGFADVVIGAGSEAPNLGALHGILLALDSRGNNVRNWPKIVPECQIGTPSFEGRPLLVGSFLYAGSCTAGAGYDQKGSKQGAAKLYRFRAKP